MRTLLTSPFKNTLNSPIVVDAGLAEGVLEGVLETVLDGVADCVLEIVDEGVLL
jgi:hypothetical protein